MCEAHAAGFLEFTYRYLRCFIEYATTWNNSQRIPRRCFRSEFAFLQRLARPEPLGYGPLLHHMDACTRPMLQAWMVS